MKKIISLLLFFTSVFTYSMQQLLIPEFPDSTGQSPYLRRTPYSNKSGRIFYQQTLLELKGYTRKTANIEKRLNESVLSCYKQTLKSKKRKKDDHRKQSKKLTYFWQKLRKYQKKNKNLGPIVNN